MTEVLQSSSSHFSSPSSTTPMQHPFINTSVSMVAQESDQEDEGRQQGERKPRDQQPPLVTILVTAFRKSLIGCTISGSKDLCSMEIGLPTNVKHVSHVTFDRFHGFLGLPVEFEPEVPRRSPSARINAENSHEEYVREQLNRGIIPDGIDVHCLAGLIKAWFRELPSGVLDSLPPELVIKSQSEEECARLVRLLPPTESALLDWTINLMADVVQLEHLNKMNARNIAMVFAPNMTQMSDPLTALMHAVQVMNFLKTLVIKALKEREDCTANSTPVSPVEPSNKKGRPSSGQVHKDVINKAKTSANDLQEGGIQSTSEKSRNGQSSVPSLKKGSKKASDQSAERESGPELKSKRIRIANRINSRAELSEAWRVKLAMNILCFDDCLWCDNQCATKSIAIVVLLTRQVRWFVFVKSSVTKELAS
ncbi:hypothetical protein V6N12_055332 [Hibiscus sabdariffa]|uniref:Uncharacterized protein n=1 Tax=Hibiscus sabdariffa TaxID=183260 RepID=A0ABR2AQR6_9ROSI